jgi:hypothetical protein
MRTAALALLIGFVLAGVAAVGDHHESTPATSESSLPSNPFAKARDGDWSVYVERIAEPEREPRVQVALWRVVSIDDESVTTRVDVRDGTDKHWVAGRPRAFSRKRAPTIAELFAIPGVRSKIENVQLEDEATLFRGRSFACRRIAFTCRGDDARDGAANVVASFSEAIPASALFGIRIAAHDATSATTIEYELAGFGRGTTTELGVSPDEIDLAAIADQRVSR